VIAQGLIDSGILTFIIFIRIRSHSSKAKFDIAAKRHKKHKIKISELVISVG
jgi:hypothetical protein